MVAITNNLLQWMRRQYLAETAFETYGTERLITRVFQIPARLVRDGRRMRVLLPERHVLVARLVAAFTPPPDTPQRGLGRPSTRCP
jgi:hypothetical protein